MSLTAMRVWLAAAPWPRLALTYGLALIGGGIAQALGLPLAWMLGPFFVCGAAAALGAELATVPYSRQLGQLTVGLAIGLRVGPSTLVAMLSLLPAMLASTVYVMVYTMIAAMLFRPLAGVNATTAFFATAAGGMADMANVAGQRGGDRAAVGIVHAIRVSTTVAVVPFLVIAFGAPGTLPNGDIVTAQSLIWLTLAFALAFPAVSLLRRTTLPNPWLLAPMLVGLMLSLSGMLVLRMPPLLITLAQLMIGAWLGSQFQRNVLARLPRVSLAGAGITLFMIAAAYGGALCLSLATDLPITTAFLALAPAAMTEMALTAKAMHLDVEIVTAFHVTRIFLVCSTILFVFRLYGRLAGTVLPDELKEQDIADRTP
ncbi:MAG: AbrB family transcriptional regulator [Alphaproteobacteria bacterium]